MNTRTKIFLVAVIMAALVAVSGCGVASTPVVEKAPIKIGWIGPLSGDAAEYGEPIKNTVALAVEEINQKGGVDGRPLQVIYEDGRCDGKTAVNAAKKLVEVDKVKIIIGGVCSGETLAVAPITEAAKVILLSPAATSPDITAAGDYVFRNMPSDSSTGKKLAELVKNYNRVAIITENTSFCTAIQKVFTNYFAASGGKQINSELFLPTERDFRSLILKVKNFNPDAIIINTQTAASGEVLLKQMQEMQINVPLYGGMSLANAELIKTVGKYVEGAMVVDAPSLDKSRPGVVEFLQDYTSKFGAPNYEIYMAAAYDDVNLLAQAIKAVGSDTDKIKNYLYDVKDYSGLVGRYGFDSNGDVTGVDFVVKQIKNGEAGVIE